MHLLMQLKVITVLFLGCISQPLLGLSAGTRVFIESTLLQAHHLLLVMVCRRRLRFSMLRTISSLEVRAVLVSFLLLSFA